MWNTLFLISFVVASIFPCHFSLSFSCIIFKLSLVNIAISPLELSDSIFLVFLKHSLVNISLGIYPCSFALSQSLDKIAFILRSVFPVVFSIAMRMTVVIVSFVSISIVKVLQSFTVFDKFSDIT